MKHIVSYFVAMIFVAIIGSTNALAASLNYTALGDSVAAGAGLVGSESNICGRSTEAYPYVIAAHLGTDVNHLACSGAKADDGIYESQWRNGAFLPPQLDNAFSSQTPDVMTITIGANDMRWSRFLWECFHYTCGETSDSLEAKVYRVELRRELYVILSRIDRWSGSNDPQVLMNGYYNPIASTLCEGTESITPSERSWLRKQTSEINGAIRSVTRLFDFAEYVPISFTGHELCTSQPWIQGLADPYPFHPTALGQSAIAEANLKRIQY